MINIIDKSESIKTKNRNDEELNIYQDQDNKNKNVFSNLEQIDKNKKNNKSKLIKLNHKI